MYEETNSEPIMRPSFHLGEAFNTENIRVSVIRQAIYSDPYYSWLEDGLGVDKLEPEAKEEILISLFESELRPQITFENGFFVSLVSSPEIFKAICLKIDEIRPAKSPKEFFYNVLMANELFEIFIKGLGRHSYKVQEKNRSFGLSMP